MGPNPNAQAFTMNRQRFCDIDYNCSDQRVPLENKRSAKAKNTTNFDLKNVLQI